MKPSNLKDITRLLIRSANWIGDAVMTIPAVRAIKKNFPYADISILAKPWVAPVFENSSHIDETVIYDAAGRHEGFAGKFRLARDLKRYEFDAAILFQNAFEAAFITFLAGIPNRIGYDTDGRSLFLTHAVSCTSDMKKVHQIEYYLGILQGTGLSHTDGQHLELEISDREQHHAGEILRQNGISQTGRIVGINPGATFGSAKRWFPASPASSKSHIARVPAPCSPCRAVLKDAYLFIKVLRDTRYDLVIDFQQLLKSGILVALSGGQLTRVSGKPLVAVNPMAKWKTKLWSDMKFSRLADQLIEQYGASVVFTGGPEDREAVQGILSGMKRSAVNFAGKTSLKMLAALYEKTDFLVTTDTGPMHLAAAVGIPVVAIFGPTAPWRTGPFGSGHQVIRAGLKCSPCFKRQC